MLPDRTEVRRESGVRENEHHQPDQNGCDDRRDIEEYVPGSFAGNLFQARVHARKLESRRVAARRRKAFFHVVHRARRRPTLVGRGEAIS